MEYKYIIKFSNLIFDKVGLTADNPVEPQAHKDGYELYCIDQLFIP